ncbi:flagellar hook-associated protein FlgK [Salinimonas chungwhensis]|uniref:flagellar hook-associated protein FlgK n=1 Tax=Salinimonas chungwhensis TaxID=265425 RepID=UPI00036CFCA1|nr:flagellar hook-associated protein FlgK [Salinimonas chungwhensis]
MIDLFSIASSGVNASNKLLQTTSNNIANVNTDGYVREQTIFTNDNVMGVGRGATERVINTFAQNQLRRDITAVGELEAFTQKTSAIDNLLASEANALSTGLSKFFSALQTAADDPTNLASRGAVLGEAQGLLHRMGTTSDYLLAKEDELNLEFDAQISEANELIQNIGDLNRKILSSKGGSNDQPNALLNERDKAINKLADIMSIEVRETKNGAKAVNLSSGESLVLENGSFSVLQLKTGADTGQKHLQLALNKENQANPVGVPITEDRLGGSLGGLFRFRNEVLSPAQRDIGQIAVAMADAVNTQNRLGMDMDMQLGGDIFSLPSLTGLNFDNSDNSLTMAGQFTPGKGSEVTDADVKVVVQSVDGVGAPLTFDVHMLNADGSPKLDSNGDAIIHTGQAVAPTGFTEIPGGVEINFDSPGAYAVDDAFLLQPAKATASELTLTTQRAETLAFASPLRAEPATANLGDARVASIRVTNTDYDISAFDGAGGIATPPSAATEAPVAVVFTSDTDFNVIDSAGNTITSATVGDNYNNLLEQAGFGADYPGYDFSLSGKPTAGDSFTLSYNSQGINDNTNAVKLAEIQKKGVVQLSTNNANAPRSLHEAYSSLVGRVGEKSSTADISLQAAEAMKNQSQSWFDSVSGVSLDEEAANLIRYQQSYAASARILSTAQELFDTILSAAR